MAHAPGGPTSVARASAKSRWGRYETYLGIRLVDALWNRRFAIEPCAPTRQNLTPSMMCHLAICKDLARASHSHP